MFYSLVHDISWNKKTNKLTHVWVIFSEIVSKVDVKEEI